MLVGAPMFMVRGSDNRLEEMGRVYVYLQRGPLDLELLPSPPTGTQVYGRYGSTIAPLGDLDQDGFNGKMVPLVNDLGVAVLNRHTVHISKQPWVRLLAAASMAVADRWCLSERVKG